MDIHLLLYCLGSHSLCESQEEQLNKSRCACFPGVHDISSLELNNLTLQVYCIIPKLIWKNSLVKNWKIN